MVFATYLAYQGAHLITSLADQGLSETLGLVTLRHGTNPISWIGIHTLGALPSMGNSKFGGDYGSSFAHQNINRFTLLMTENF